MRDDIKRKIQQHLPDATVYIVNPLNDGMHYKGIVISEDFNGKPLVERHRIVLGPLRADFADDSVHAFGLKAFTPEEWEKRKDEFQRYVDKG